MKGKFKFFGHIGLALFLISALVLSLAPVAQAATSVTDVWVQFTQSTYNKTDTASDFTIHFTPTTSLSRGVDTITVWFPDGDITMGPDNFSLSSAVTTASYYDVDPDGEVVTNSAYDCTSAATLSTTGYRITVTTPVDLAAGTPCSLRVEAAAVVACADSTSHDQYKVKLYTSQDTTPVLSDAFDIDATSPTTVALSLTPSTAGSAGQYSFTLTLANEVAIGGTVTIIFPYGTTVPSSIAADKIKVSTDGGSVYEDCTVDATINQKARTVTITTPVALGADGNNIVRFTSGANILNPTTATAYTDCYAATSVDELFVAEDSGYSITANTATKIGFDNDAISNYSDDATMVDMYSSALYVQVQDTYGNLKDPDTEPTISFSSSSGTGIFYDSDYAQMSSKATTSGAVSVFYKDTAAGTVTITASATSYDSGTWTMTIAPGVGLYDGNGNLIDTLAPVTTSPVKEADGYHGGDYVNDAISAAVTGDTVKLGDGIYEVDTVITVSKKVTVTSVSGASSTTIRNTAEIDKALEVTTDGTAANPIVIEELTFQRLRSAVDIDMAIRNAGNDYVTVQDCVFNYIQPDENSASEGVVWFTNTDTITSATIQNNTFNNCVTTWPDMGGGAKSGCIIMDGQAFGGTSAISGVTISGNTLTDCGQYGITFGGNSSNSASGVISNNTITNGQSPIDICDYITSLSVTGNTITSPYNYGVLIEGTNNASVTVKNNTITGCAGTSGAIRVQEDGATITVQYNHITGTNSAGYAIRNTGTGTTDCRYNWYGSDTGPAYTALTGATITKSNPNGTGDAISDKVTYYPWLHKSLADVVADNASYQASNMYLVSGWNTMSTPVKLISAADTIDELIPSGMTIGYYYDSGAWAQITSGYTLSPCDAVYVKMSAATYVQFKFDASAFSNPSKALDAGWNLISLASLDSSKTVANTMACVDLTAANLPGWSQVISPSMNAAQTDIYGAAETAWAESSGEGAGKTMQPGLGYWCYMQNAATLAGFELTPIVPDLD